MNDYLLTYLGPSLLLEQRPWTTRIQQARVFSISVHVVPFFFNSASVSRLHLFLGYPLLRKGLLVVGDEVTGKYPAKSNGIDFLSGMDYLTQFLQLDAFVSCSKRANRTFSDLFTVITLDTKRCLN